MGLPPCDNDEPDPAFPSVPIVASPGRGDGTTKSFVTGFRRFRSAMATSEMQARSFALAHWAFGIELRIPGLSCENADQTFSFVRSPLMRPRAAGRCEMLLAVGTKPVSAVVR
jgi:hypothetical protein